jgi:hypothetical protein
LDGHRYQRFAVMSDHNNEVRSRLDTIA